MLSSLNIFPYGGKKASAHTVDRREPITLGWRIQVWVPLCRTGRKNCPPKASFGPVDSKCSNQPHRAWTTDSIVENVLRTVWNALSVAVGAISTLYAVHFLAVYLFAQGMKSTNQNATVAAPPVVGLSNCLRDPPCVQ